MTGRSWRNVAAVFSLLLTVGFDAAAQARPLIAPRVGGTVIQNAPGAALARKRPVEVDFSVLSSARDALQLRPGVAQQMEIPFFEDHTLTINLERVERIGRGVTNFYGSVEGDPLGQAVVTQSRGIVGVTVFTQGMAYQVRVDGEGSYVAQEVNRANLTEGPNDMPLPPVPLGGGDSVDARPPIANDDGSIVDVMVIYSTKARQGAGSVAAIESEIDSAIAITNSGYVNSGVTQRVRLVHTEELAYAADTATLNIQTALTFIQGNSAIATKRTQYGADIVSFWIEGSSGGATSGGCGVGYYMSSLSASFAPFAYNVLIRDLCAVANQSFPHELGHNMGLAHDAFVNSGSLLYPYGQGYVDFPNRFRTIMAYNNQCDSLLAGSVCTRINYFSSPTHSYLGNTTGLAATADNVRALNNTRVVVSNFKASVPVTGGEPDEINFAAASYNVTEGATRNVMIVVQRVGSGEGAASITWTTSNGTAVAGQDFGTLGNPGQRTGTLNWAAGDITPRSISTGIASSLVPILNNTAPEATESFSITLSNVAGNAVIGPVGVATITIQDDEVLPTSQLRFSQPKYLVEESGGTVTLSVERINIASQDVAASATYSTIAGTALATSDYIAKTGTLNWAAGETGTRDITVNIVNNTVAELPEAFRVVLSNLSSGTVLGETPEATVTILDDDELWPPGGVMPPGFQACSCATTGWHVSTDVGAYQGLYSLKANEIEDNQAASVEMTGTFAAGIVNFRVKVSSEATFDPLLFYIDDVLQAPQWSGTTNTGWQLSPSYAITAGPHVLRWTYAKDTSGSVGMDTAYIDGLVTPAFTPAP